MCSPATSWMNFVSSASSFALSARTSACVLVGRMRALTENLVRGSSSGIITVLGVASASRLSTWPLSRARHFCPRSLRCSTGTLHRGNDAIVVVNRGESIS
ncbi:hypothetical protein PF008_g29527 [Phytophthora fragariae]|uniref:Uncharacterized protein n=1 Tax=Phytophthora fragariae TaxID=53985 RepID=A0A6G0Q8Z3_9STRA|nr:hypothetical protein PF008_g29527 [Phytophthora fragariae]